MARIQYRPSAQRRGFNPQQLSTAGISRMREESNRIIQGMERRRRAEQEQDAKDLQAMKENAAYTEQITRENKAIELQNLQNRRDQALANIQIERDNTQSDIEATNTIITSLVDFSQTIAKTAAQREAQMIKDQTAEAMAEPLKPFDPKTYQYRDAEYTQLVGAFEDNKNVVEDGVLNGQSTAQTKKYLIANHGFQGVKGKVLDNRYAYQAFEAILKQQLNDTEQTFTATNGTSYTGAEAHLIRIFIEI